MFVRDYFACFKLVCDRHISNRNLTIDISYRQSYSGLVGFAIRTISFPVRVFEYVFPVYIQNCMRFVCWVFVIDHKIFL